MVNGGCIIVIHNSNVFNYFVLMEVLNQKEVMYGKIQFQRSYRLHMKEQLGVYVMTASHIRQQK